VIALRRALFWEFERGTLLYDVVCLLVLLFVALAPSSCLGDPMAVRP
jgi:hypothetical protein